MQPVLLAPHTYVQASSTPPCPPPTDRLSRREPKLQFSSASTSHASNAGKPVVASGRCGQADARHAPGAALAPKSTHPSRAVLQPEHHHQQVSFAGPISTCASAPRTVTQAPDGPPPGSILFLPRPVRSPGRLLLSARHISGTHRCVVERCRKRGARPASHPCRDVHLGGHLRGRRGFAAPRQQRSQSLPQPFAVGSTPLVGVLH
ncbi:hypothetical protein F5X68DRAFT_25194 [Plectosphaerella plurivora]|uniref:Uncharacterized protein n=1 Tax=Plectosphaerella plurivora TaxID=936078 RepID=A0A9P8V900_9PEZI|nr:hypothetical protein F5X68DRAFT_25194 [Plectosphaerella plurivora]